MLCLEVIVQVAMHTELTPLNSKILGKNMGVSKRYLEPLLRKMVQYKLLNSIPGPKGGYVLLSEKRKLTLSDIFISANKIRNDLTDKSYQYSDISLENIINPLWKEIEDDILMKLDDISIADICKHYQKDKDNNADYSNFTI